jgi:hypothetical protein
MHKNVRVEASSTQLLQLMEFPDFDDPAGKRRHLLAAFAKARLSDASNQEISNGVVHVWIRTTLSAASLSILTRLLQPYDGYFVMLVDGSYGVDQASQVANVYADEVTWTNIQIAGKTTGSASSAAGAVKIPAPPRRVMPVGS